MDEGSWWHFFIPKFSYYTAILTNLASARPPPEAGARRDPDMALCLGFLRRTRPPICWSGDEDRSRTAPSWVVSTRFVVVHSIPWSLSPPPRVTDRENEEKRGNR